MRPRDVIKLSRETTILPRPLSGFSGKKGLSHRRFLSPALLLSSLSTVDAGEANENVRRDRIIHCPTKTGGASRLFGKRIHLVRATAILDGDRAKCFSDPRNSTFRFVLCCSNTARKGVIALSKSRAICYIAILYYYYYIRTYVIHLKKTIQI